MSAPVVPWWAVLPFAALLASIALLPLLRSTRRLWERPWFQLAVSTSFGVPMAIYMWGLGAHGQVVHTLVEYVQFVTLLLSLFVVSGGVYVRGDIPATPRANSTLLALGAVLASLVGTTGAAMLMVRPLLAVNRERTHRVHTIVFAIFVIANCGGVLTPLGDPPLFLGLLRGVPFLWTLELFPQWLFVNGLLIVSYWSLDRVYYAREPAAALRADATQIEPIGIAGKRSLASFALIVASVALLPSVNLHAIERGEATLSGWIPWRELAMLAASALSLALGDPAVRYEKNQFSWAPIVEVAALFLGIFLAMVPALAYLAELAPSLALDEVTFFVFTGALSSMLDNAPTYATFFEMARQLGGEPAVAGVREIYLVSISLGAVFCGALTYIGNGPNFMVKSIADAAGVKMPSFGGFALFWAFRYLVPILCLMVMLFIASAPWVNVAGAVLTVVWAGVQVRRGLRASTPDFIQREAEA